MASKVIFLPADDEVAAQSKLQEWLAKDDKILFVVMGDTGIALETVKRADKLSGGALQEPRWVIHAPVHHHVIDILNTLADPDALITNWEDVLAVVISITDIIRDMIKRGGPQPTYSRIEDAYMLAESDGI